MLRKPPQIAAFVTAILCGPIALATDGPITERLDKARAEYEAELESIRIKADAWFGEAEKAARKRGSKSQLDQVMSARKEFEHTRGLPRSATALRQKQASAKSEMVAEYRRAIQMYTKEGMDKEAGAAEDELNELLSADLASAFLAQIPPLRKKVDGRLFASDGTILGRKIVVQGRESPHGIFLHPPDRDFSEIVYKLDKKWRKFRCGVAVPTLGEDVESRGIGSPLTFEIIGDGKLLWRFLPVQTFDNPQWRDVNVEGVDTLTLRVVCPGGSWCARAVWLEPCVSGAVKSPE